MAQRNFQTELLARNLALANGIAPSSAIDWDSGAWRGPRVLVPVMLEALPVSVEQAASAQWAAVGIDPLNPHAGRPEPFATVGGRPAGIHLHWSLPDALTRGQRDNAAPDVALPASAQPQSGQQEVRGAQRTAYPAVPDRWLVVRTLPGATPTSPRRVAAWVIAGALDPAQRRVVPLADWREDRSQTARPALNATGPGEPTFAVYYDNVKNLLGFHDPLIGVAHGPVSYMVCGWYGRLEDDPLYGPQDEHSWLRLIDGMAWALSNVALDALRHQSTLADELLDSADEAQTLNVLGLKGIRKAVSSRAAVSTQAAKAYEDAVEVGVGVGRFLRDADRRNVVLEAVRARQRHFLRHWPRQLLCHGAVFDVAWGSSGGTFNDRSAGVPAPGSVTLAVGNTSAQAMAALAAREAGDASLARVLDAFATGALPELSQQSGLARLEALLHAEDFASRPGGFVVDRIEQGDAFAPASGAETPPPYRSNGAAGLFAGIKDAVEIRGGGQVKRKFFRAGASMKELQEDLETDDDKPRARAGDAPTQQSRRWESVRRPLPRWFEPRDPVLLLRQARRAYKHGEDTTRDGNLACRISTQEVRQLSVLPWQGYPGGAVKGPLVSLKGADLVADELLLGQIPVECRTLLHEAVLLDPSVATVARHVMGLRGNAMRVAGAEMATSAVLGQRLQVEQTLLLAAALDPQIDTQSLTAISNIEGTVPTPVSQQYWRSPWTPIELAWEVEWYPSPEAERDWQLDQTDFALRSGRPTGTTGAPALTLRGRSILTPAVARTLERQLERFLKDEDAGAQDEATPDQEADLARVMNQFVKLDVLGAALGGLHDGLMARAPVPGLAATPQPDAWQPVPEALRLWLLRAGHLRVRRARVIDAFGQFHDLAEATLANPVRAEDMQSPAGAAFMAMPPRLNEPARLMFRLLEAAVDGNEATRERSPVCGWVVPDHLDGALELFDATGQAQGQLQPADDGRTLEWQGVPGVADALGAPPQIAQAQLSGFVAGLLAHGLRDRERLQAVAPPTETALAALLRMIDTTLWTTDPVGRAGNEHLSLLVGHPLALVRAELRLEVQDGGAPAAAQGALYDDAREELERTPLPVRLGELLALDDGLMGYFVNDDFSRFYPVHESLAPQARPAGPGEGYLNSMALPPETDPRALEHPYVDRAPVVMIRPGQTVRLTLLLDPRGAVHATCGFLPRKKIELMREHIAPALAALAFTFRVGPVLVDPDTVRMPLPAEIAGGWSWVRRVNVTTWQEDAVVKASQDALLPDAPSMLSEGWLKLSGSLAKPEP